MGLLDQMQPTPRNRMMGLLADALTSANQFATQMDPRYANKRQNQTLGLLADAVSLGSLAKTADRASYGEPLTNAGKANVPFLKPETADALMMAPLSPRTALGALGLAGGIGDAGAMRAATVWHGSPHKFDKFDASKIGTGEGAQAYGHGLYLAESPDVAKAYQAALSRPDSAGIGKADDIAAWAYSSGGGDKAESLKFLTDEIDRLDAYGKFGKKISRDDYVQALDILKGGQAKTGGALYKVDLPDEHIAKMLDWDKPLSQQATEVQRAIKIYKGDNWWVVNKDRVTGEKLTREIHGGQPAEFSSALADMGVPGIRYLDGGSRAAGQGSSNFVVFPGNEGLLKILERNGAPVGK